MVLGFLLTILVLFHLLPHLSAQTYDGSNSSCPENFECPSLGHMTFPFANFSQPDCGLCMVDCGFQPSPSIKLSPYSWQSFLARSILHSNIIKLHDPYLQNLLHNSSCDLFMYSIFLPNSPSISFTIKMNITLFRCNKDPQHLGPGIKDYFNKNQYKKNDSCQYFDLYYRNPKYHEHDHQSELPPGCSFVHLPMIPLEYITRDTELLQMLIADFDLEWHVSRRCHECHREGGRCEANVTNEFNCSNSNIRSNSSAERKCNKWKTILLLTALLGAVLLVIVLAIFLVLCRKKKIKNPFYFLARNFSKTISKRDLEGRSVYFGIPVFSYRELEEVTNHFDASKELGDGGFGTVYYGKLRDGREVAIKRQYEHNFKRIAQFMNEVEILTRLRHRNLVSLYGCTSRRSHELLLVYEYIPNGTVADHLHGDRAKDQSLTWPIRLNIAIETAGALAYLHASDTIHRDVKTNNILLDHNFEVKVADFGLSRLFPNDVSHVSTAPQGTPGYVDPEYHQCYQLTDKSDVYSFGVVLIELISSMPAVDISRHRHEINLANLAINRIQRRAFNELIDPSLGYELDPEVMRMTTSVAELAFRCLQLDKEMRPTMDEVLETLIAIRDCKENCGEETTESSAESRGRLIPASPESDDVVLLRKNIKCSSSPNSVSDIWISGSTTTSSSR